MKKHMPGGYLPRKEKIPPTPMGKPPGGSDLLDEGYVSRFTEKVVALPNLRPCEVDGAGGYRFHRFIEEDQVLFNLHRMMTQSDADALLEVMRRELYTVPGATAQILRRTLALVETSGGALRKVAPELVRFTDRKD